MRGRPVERFRSGIGKIPAKMVTKGAKAETSPLWQFAQSREWGRRGAESSNPRDLGRGWDRWRAAVGMPSGGEVERAKTRMY